MTSPTYLPALELEPTQPAIASVIWLHGLGANGYDFEPIVPELKLPPELSVRFIFPHAPSIPVTINAGYIMPAWYDIIRLSVERELNHEQLLASSAAVAALIDRERARGVASERIVLAGFSQGGAVAYQTALTYPHRLAGLLVLSAYFPTADSVTVHPQQQQLPTLVCHGVADSVVPEVLGQQAVAALRIKGLTPEYRTFVMDHEVCVPEVAAISAWLQQCLPAQA